MLGFPTHWIYLVKKDGTRENVENADFSTKSQVRTEIKNLIEMYSKNIDTSIYEKAQYTNNNGDVLYECTINECL